jgi:Tfp pilus assembly protein PilO
MLSTFYVKLFVLVLSLAIILVISYQLFFNKSAETKKNVDYIKKDDLEAQKNYEKQKSQINNFFSLNIKDKLELSWQFLYEITDIILKKFSTEDKNMVHELGDRLFKAGMHYEHVVDYGITREQLAKGQLKDTKSISR